VSFQLWRAGKAATTLAADKVLVPFSFETYVIEKLAV